MTALLILAPVLTLVAFAWVPVRTRWVEANRVVDAGLALLDEEES